MTNYDFPVDGVGAWDMGTGSWLSDGKAAMSSHKYPRERLISFFGRANYSYKDRYMLTGSVRHEGSSKFGKIIVGEHFGQYQVDGVYPMRHFCVTSVFSMTSKYVSVMV